MSNEGFFGLSIGEILRGYRSGTITPQDVARICLDQVRRHDPQCFAMEVFSAETLLAESARAAKGLGSGKAIRLLEGIPVGVKDIFNTADFPTQMGSPLWTGFTPGNDARVVFYLKQAGAIIPGKTVTAEFAVHTLGKTLNPHDSEPPCSSVSETACSWPFCWRPAVSWPTCISS
ncbi:MAG: hypothetical protein C4519_18970 [Desulfobacteraceae bacterium]|nr:MAG: hypothetical protein C4519_18970 [Desulfobacteraceae bacterium]